jgi:WD40 repeat protein
VVWVVDVSSRKIESRHEAEDNAIHGTGAAARLSPDNKLLYLGHADASQSRHRIQCLDLTTGREVWQTEDFTASALTALALSADGRFLASASGDPNISIWDAATGKPLHQLEGHTSWVSKLVFTRDGHRLISAASDQTIRLWDTETWTNTKVLRGHVEEVNGLAISEAAQLIASADRDGNLMLWKAETPGVSDGYLLLPEHLRTRWASDLGPVCMLHGSSNPPEFFDLSRGVSLGTPPGLGDLNLLGAWPPGWIDRWDGTNQIIIEEWSDSQLRRRGAVTLDRGRRPITADFSPEKRLLAWAERGASNSVFLASLATPGQRNELKGGIAGPRRLLFSQDGKYLAAFKWLGASANFSQVWDLPPLCVWNVETRQSVMTLSESVNDIAFAAGGRVLVALVLMRGIDHEIRFYDLEHPDRPPRVVPGKDLPRAIEVSQDGRLVAFATGGGTVRICDAVTGEWIDDLHGHLNEVEGLAFSKDAHRLVSAGSGLEAVKLWDFDTRQELLTLPGNGFRLTSAWWSADEDTILAGTPWQTWHAPSWEEIAAAEAKDPPSPGYGGQGKADLPRRSQAKAEAQRP